MLLHVCIARFGEHSFEDAAEMDARGDVKAMSRAIYGANKLAALVVGHFVLNIDYVAQLKICQ